MALFVFQNELPLSLDSGMKIIASWGFSPKEYFVQGQKPICIALFNPLSKDSGYSEYLFRTDVNQKLESVFHLCKSMVNIQN